MCVGLFITQTSLHVETRLERLCFKILTLLLKKATCLSGADNINISFSFADQELVVVKFKKIAFPEHFSIDLCQLQATSIITYLLDNLRLLLLLKLDLF